MSCRDLVVLWAGVLLAESTHTAVHGVVIDDISAPRIAGLGSPGADRWLVPQRMDSKAYVVVLIDSAAPQGQARLAAVLLSAAPSTSDPFSGQQSPPFKAQVFYSASAPQLLEHALRVTNTMGVVCSQHCISCGRLDTLSVSPGQLVSEADHTAVTLAAALRHVLCPKLAVRGAPSDVPPIPPETLVDIQQQMRGAFDMLQQHALLGDDR